MSNPVFLNWIQDEIRSRLFTPSQDNNKTQLLTALSEQRGASALLEVGLSFADLPLTPVVEALTTVRTPSEVLERWTRFECFCHTHNRVEFEVLESTEGSLTLHLRHYALDAHLIEPVNHLFIWGLLIVLLERSGLGGFSVSTAGRVENLLYEEGAILPIHSVPPGAGEALFRWQRKPQPRAQRPFAQRNSAAVTLTEKITEIIQSAPSLSWHLKDVARRLGKSTRSVQRELKLEQAKFSQLLLQTRIDIARDLMKTNGLSLTEIAFCAGFSDLAHFSRSARQQLYISPSEYRVLLES